MGRHVVVPKIDTKKRDEDFMKMDSLHYLADQNGLKLMAFYETPEGVFISYLKPSIAREPKQDECRDFLDYDLKLAAWIKTCTVKSKNYKTFEEMILGEIDRLKALL